MKERKNELVNSIKAQKKELSKFRKENSLNHGEYPEDKKLSKTIKKMESEIEANEKELEEVREKIKEENGGHTGGFAAKYTYPLVDDGKGGKREMDATEKKKFRVKARNEAKKADQAPEKEVKSEKKAKKEEKTQAEQPVKKKKKPAKTEEEDD